LLVLDCSPIIIKHTVSQQLTAILLTLAGLLTFTSLANRISSLAIFLIFPVDSCLLIAYNKQTRNLS